MKIYQYLIPIFIALLCTSCKNDGDSVSTSILQGTQWKLIGFVDVEDMHFVEPGDCTECYTLSFEPDGIITIYSSTNVRTAKYQENIADSTFAITNLSSGKVFEVFDGDSYIDALEKVKKFVVTDDQLKLYDGETRYLRFRKNDEEIIHSPLTGIAWKLDGIADTRTNLMDIIDWEACAGCYTLLFQADGTISGRSLVNTFTGGYSRDVRHLTLMPVVVITPEEPAEGQAYLNALKEVVSFVVTNNKLELYHHETSYLKFDREEDTGANPPLIGTTWKLEGFVDTRANNMKIVEPRICDKCYTLVFKADGTISGNTSTNTLSGGYTSNNGVIEIQSIGTMTELGELPDGNTFIDALKNAGSLVIINGKMRLDYDETHYMRFKKL